MLKLTLHVENNRWGYVTRGGRPLSRGLKETFVKQGLRVGLHNPPSLYDVVYVSTQDLPGSIRHIGKSPLSSPNSYSYSELNSVILFHFGSVRFSEREGGLPRNTLSLRTFTTSSHRRCFVPAISAEFPRL